jgi:hypothetical protein
MLGESPAAKDSPVDSANGLDERASFQVPRTVVVPLLLVSISYNAVLAIINGHFKSLTITEVAICEALILIALVIAVVRGGLVERDAPSLGLGTAFLIGALLLSFLNNGIVVEALRNIAILVLFTMLGIRSSQRTLRTAFAAAIGLVLAVMIFEMLWVDGYIALFDPLSYYFNTRGLGQDSLRDDGLFPNALGFDGRFSFGLFSTARTSSIFLEQTSLANFASVVVIYLVTMWRSLSRGERILGVTFVVLALLSNNTRMASAFAVISFAAYFAYPYFPKRGTLLLPLILIGLAVLLTTQFGPSKEDDLAGRLGLSIQMLSLTDMPAMLGTRAFESGRFPDSGYSYILYSSSIVGALLLWLYVSLIVPFESPEQKRCAWAIALFFFMNLLVSGNAIFTMKVAGPLWLLAGYMRSPMLTPEPRAVRSRAVRPLRRPIVGATA